MTKQVDADAATITLPTIAEIEAATDLLSSSPINTKVFRVNEHFAVKTGPHVKLEEAETIRFLAENSKVPVPKVYNAFRDPGTRKTYIIMQYIPGDTLQQLRPSLNSAEEAEICKLLRDAITELRSIPPPGYFGKVNRKPLTGAIFSSVNPDPQKSGPFESQEAMNLAIINKVREREPEAYIRFFRSMIDRTFHSHRTVFTHTHLQETNIMVQRLEYGDRDDGCPRFKVTLIDWKNSGWYPEFWEFCNATIIYRNLQPKWLELVPHILDQYLIELLMMQSVYSSMFPFC